MSDKFFNRFMMVAAFLMMAGSAVVFGSIGINILEQITYITKDANVINRIY